MTTLHDRLRDLADDAPGGDDRRDPWERGRREHVVRRAGTAFIVAVAVVALAATLGTWQVRADPTPLPVATGAAEGIPNKLFTPSPWLAGTDDEGPLGPLAAVLPADRGGWTGASNGVVGISASTQEYRFLDLPAYVATTEAPVLSPDGARVAWWTSGTPTGTRNTFLGDTVTGYAVYDSVTGEVARHEVPTEHGINPETMLWADDDLLVLAFGQVLDGDGEVDENLLRSGDTVIESWRIGDEPVRPAAAPGWTVESAAGDGKVLVRQEDKGFLVVDAVTARPTAAFTSARLGHIGVVLSPSMDRVAAQTGTTFPTSISVGDVRIDQVDALRTVDATQDTFVVVGWADDDTVVGIARGDDPDDFQTRTLVRTAVDGSEQDVVTDLSDIEAWSDVSYAADLLAAPVVRAADPARPLDPRLVLGLAIGTVLLAAAALLAWRRRRVRLS